MWNVKEKQNKSQYVIVNNSLIQGSKTKPYSEGISGQDGKFGNCDACEAEALSTKDSANFSFPPTN